MKTPMSRLLSVAAGAISSFLFATVAMNITHQTVLYYSISADLVTIVSLKFVRTSCIVFAVLAAYPVVWEFLVQLSLLGFMPERLAQRIVRSVEANQSNELLLSRRFMLGLLFSVNSVGILLLVLLLGRMDFVPADDFSMSLYETVSFIRKSDIRTSGYPHVVNAYFSTEWVEPNRYAEDCLTLAKMFKNAGARGVIFPLPESSVEIGNVEIDNTLWRRVDSIGISVLGTRIPLKSMWYSGRNGFLRGTYGYDRLWSPSPYKRFKLIDSKTMSVPNPPSDILIPLLKLYSGQPTTASVDFDGSRLKIGGIEIPTTADGTMYSRNLFTTHTPIDIGIKRVGSFNRSPIFMGNLRTETAEFGPSELGKLKLLSLVENFGGTPMVLDTAALKSRVFGKIVLVTSNIAQTFSTFHYASAFENILAGTVTRKIPNGFLWYSFLALLTAAGLTVLVRPLLATVIILCSGFVYIYIGSVLLDSSHLLVDIFYPLLTVGISSFTFPVLKFAILSGSQGK